MQAKGELDDEDEEDEDFDVGGAEAEAEAAEAAAEEASSSGGSDVEASPVSLMCIIPQDFARALLIVSVQCGCFTRVGHMQWLLRAADHHMLPSAFAARVLAKLGKRGLC